MKIQVWKKLGAEYVELINIPVEKRRFVTKAKLSLGEISLGKQPSFFAPGPSGVSRGVFHAKRHSGRERRRTVVFAG